MGADYKRRLTYIGMQVGNIGMRTCCLMELHFLPVLFVLFRGLLQTHALIRSASKYSLKKIEKLEHTLFLGSDQWATSTIHSSSVMFLHRRSSSDLICWDTIEVFLLQPIMLVSYRRLHYISASCLCCIIIVNNQLNLVM